VTLNFLVMSLHDLEGSQAESNSRSYKVKIKFKENTRCILSNSIKDSFLIMHIKHSSNFENIVVGSSDNKMDRFQSIELE
jgi:hypothetical protein